MKKLVLILICFLLVGCKEEKICSSEFPTMCHTKREWQIITDDGYKIIECMNNHKNQKKVKYSVSKLVKLCRARIYLEWTEK